MAAKKTAQKPSPKTPATKQAAKKSAPTKAAAQLEPKSAPKKAAARPEPKSAPKKAAAKPEPKSAPKPSIADTVKRAAAKVAQVAASAALKVLEPGASRKAPTFELSDENGKTVSSSSLAGKPYLLYFYPKDDTPGCTKEACDIRDSFARFGKQGLRVLGVSPDSAQSHTKFIK
ncbi:MAG: bcp 1, partial [Polyangiaceae bacterium]|nr:bcp 1 [Polyangiaceae bacterium]